MYIVEEQFMRLHSQHTNIPDAWDTDHWTGLIIEDSKEKIDWKKCVADWSNYAVFYQVTLILGRESLYCCDLCKHTPFSFHNL